MTEIPDKRIPISYLRQRIFYSDGKLFWLPRSLDEFKSKRAFGNWKTRFSEKEAFISVNRDGYKAGEIRVNGKRYFLLAHVAVWAICKGGYPRDEIDHINGIREDNRIENLREATRTQNVQNSIKAGRFLPGAYPCGNVWKSQIREDGKTKYLGTFSSEIEAHAAYVENSIRVKGEFSPYS